MVNADDIINNVFGKSSQDKKCENFEVSTLSLVLRQLGLTAEDVRNKKEELGAAYGWDWFNGEHDKLPRLGSTRDFNFNFWELITKPSTNPISKAFAAFDDGNHCCLIFNVFDHGRWVATNVDVSQQAHIHVVTNGLDFKVLPFAQFFNRWKLIDE